MIGESGATIARNVRRLEDQLGVKLTTVSTSGAHLTDIGEKLALQLAALDYQLYTMAHGIRHSAEKLEGSVRLAATEGLAGVFLASAIVDFQTDYPNIQLHIKTPTNVNDIRQNMADIMIGFSDSQNSDVTVKKLGYLHFVPMASKQYISKFGIPSESSLSRHKFVDSEFYHAKTPIWEGWQKLTGIGKVVSYCDSSLAYGVAVRKGQGIGLLGTYLLDDETFVAVDLGYSASVQMYAQVLTERLQAPSVKAVFDWLPSIFGQHLDWFSKTPNLKRPRSHGLATMLNGFFGAAVDGVR